MKIGRFAPNLFIEHLDLIHNPNTVIKILSYIYFWGNNDHHPPHPTPPPPKKFSMVEIRSTVNILSNANVLLNLTAKCQQLALYPLRSRLEQSLLQALMVPVRSPIDIDV